MKRLHIIMMIALAAIAASCNKETPSERTDPEKQNPGEEPDTVATVVEPLSGLYSVSEDLAVRFAPGNLGATDGSLPAAITSDQTAQGGLYSWDELFSDNAKVNLPQGWTCLTSAQWRYLLQERTMTGGAARYLLTEGGMYIFPDDYDGSGAGGDTVFLPADASGYGRYLACDALDGNLSYNIKFGPTSLHPYNAYGSKVRMSVRPVQTSEQNR